MNSEPRQPDNLSARSPADIAPSGGKRRRWGLYLPFILLGLVLAGWSAFWFVARGMIESRIDAELARAEQRGDRWTCGGRSIAGFPFRFEIRCAEVTLTRSATAGVVAMTSGPLLIIGQPHTPSHIILHGTGPLAMRLANGARIEVRWDQAEASRRAKDGELDRFSLVVRKPVLTVTDAQGSKPPVSAATFESHLRRSPSRPAADRARELSLRIGQMAWGELDGWFGDANPSDVDLSLTTIQGDLLARGLTPPVLEEWRLAGGRLLVEAFSLRKGLKHVAASGDIQIDAERRLAGRLEPSAANIDQIAGIRLRGGAMDLASALSGRPQPTSPDGLKPLPAIELRGGRFGLGPLRLPFPPLQPLY